MNRLNAFFLLACLVSWNCSGGSELVQAQTLREQLRQEPTERLIQQARQTGNAASGAIVFASSQVACTSCHLAGSEDLLGPDLTKLDETATDAHVVEAMLDPSATIRKGFEQSRVLTLDGKILVGRIVEEADDYLVLRNPSEPQKKQLIRTSEIETRQRIQQSAMPEDLVDRLENRQQFLDLLSYLFQLRDLQMDAGATTQPPTDERPDPVLQGLAIAERYQCMACHSGLPRGAPFPMREAPDLAWARGHLQPDFIQALLTDPQAAHPGTTMPQPIPLADIEQRRQVALELTHFVISLGSAAEEDSPGTSSQEAAQRGRELYHSIGCVACHAPRDEQGQELPLEGSVPLAHLSRKYTFQGLSRFLGDPHQVRPLSSMPAMQLTHWEALDLASYFLQTGDEVEAEPFSVDQQLAERGRQHAARFGCAQCHRSLTQHGVELTQNSVVIEQVDQGCLSEQAGNWPGFNLTTEERADLRAWLEDPYERLSDAQQIQLTLTHFNCIACHERAGRGGVSDERDGYFQTTNPNLGPQGRIPPRLTHVGAKLQPQWMRDVLVSGKSIRPYMATRMPQFGKQNVVHLVDLLQRVDKLPEAPAPPTEDEKTIREAGFELAGKDGLNCIACHTFQQKPAETMPAVDLTEMTERLHKNWFAQYMRQPQWLSPQTVMPTFWPNGKSARTEILDGDADRQIEALWQYLLDGRQARTPKGLIREQIELLAGDEAVMLRRSWPGVGKRGIGVGYPSQVNLVFDAEQMRLASLWQGRFADPGGVWFSQGHGMARPLERDVLEFAKGPDVDDANQPWIVDVGRPPEHQFQGYALDSHRRPTFRYRFRDIEITDGLLDGRSQEDGSAFLRRTLTLTTDKPQAGLSVRLASGPQLTPLDGRRFAVGNRLTVAIEGDWEGQIKPNGQESELRELQIPLDLPPGKTTIEVLYEWKGAAQ